MVLRHFRREEKTYQLRQHSVGFPANIELIYMENDNVTILVIGGSVQSKNPKVIIFFLLAYDLKFGVDAITGVDRLTVFYLVITVMKGGNPIGADALSKESVDHVQKQGERDDGPFDLRNRSAVKRVSVNPVAKATAGTEHPDVGGVHLSGTAEFHIPDLKFLIVFCSTHLYSPLVALDTR